MGIFSQANGKKKKKGGLAKKSGKTQQKRKNRMMEVDMHDTSITVRLPDNEVKKRVVWIKENIGYCQICGTYRNLDYPHHALDGVGRKDDRTMIDICCKCHSYIHAINGYTGLKKSEEEVVAISWDNNMRYLKYEDYLRSKI